MVTRKSSMFSLCVNHMFSVCQELVGRRVAPGDRQGDNSVREVHRDPGGADSGPHRPGPALHGPQPRPGLAAPSHHRPPTQCRPQVCG